MSDLLEESEQPDQPKGMTRDEYIAQERLWWVRFIPLLPTINAAVEQACEISNEPTWVAVPRETWDVLAKWRTTNLGDLVVSAELMEWAIANAPAEMVSNMARMGFVA